MSVPSAKVCRMRHSAWYPAGRVINAEWCGCFRSAVHQRVLYLAIGELYVPLYTLAHIPTNVELGAREQV